MDKIEAIFASLLKAAPISRWAMILAGPAMTAFAGGLAWVIWKGGWAPARAEQQLFYLGGSLFGVLAIIGIVIITLASAKVHVQGPGGFSGEIESDPADPQTKTTTTTTTETKP